MSLVVSDILDSVSAKFDLRSLFEVIVPTFGFPDDQDDDNDDDQNGDDQNDDDGNDDGDDDQSGSAGDDTKVKNPQAQKASKEAAKWRKEAKEAKAKNEAYEKAQREQDDKQRSELEIANRDLKEARDEAEASKAENITLKRTLAFHESGILDQFQDRDVAKALLEPHVAKLELNDEGVYDTDDFEELAKDLLKRKPKLAKVSDEDDDDGGEQLQSSGGPVNNSKRKKQGNTKEELAKKFPALNTR